MNQTIETRLLTKFLELRPQDQEDVLDYIEHVMRVREINDAVSYQENALKEIRDAFDNVSDF